MLGYPWQEQKEADFRWGKFCPSGEFLSQSQLAPILGHMHGRCKSSGVKRLAISTGPVGFWVPHLLSP